MDCNSQVDDKVNVVFTVHWTCAGTQESNGKTYNASVYSTCGVPYVAETAYTPYADLTQEQVLEWVWANGVNQMATEAAVQAQIDTKMVLLATPPLSLPWNV